MKKTLLLFASVLMCTSAFAKTETFTPSKEWAYRTNVAATPTAWNSGFPKEITAAGTLEISSSARIFVVQEFDLSTIVWSDVLSVSLTYTRGGSQGGKEMAAWLFGSTAWGADNNSWSDSWKNNIADALGTQVGNGSATVEPIFYANRGDGTTYTKEFSAEEIEAIKTSLINGKLNLLVTSTARSGVEGSYTYSANATRTDIYNYLHDNCAKLNIEVEGEAENIVVNTTQGVKYNDLQSALTASVSNDVITVYKDQTVTSRIDVGGKILTIQGATGNEVITLGNKGSMLVLARNTTGTDLTIKNIILDGNNYSSTLNMIEASGKLTLDNVTVRNYTTSNGTGVIVSKSSGNLTLQDVAFENCHATAENIGVVFRGATVNAKKNISFTNCSDVQFYLENGYLRAEEIAWTSPLRLFRKSAADGTLVVSAPGASGGELEPYFHILNPGLRLTHSSHWTDMKLAAAPTFALTAAVPYATFCVDYDAVIPEGVRAYRAESEDGQKISFKRIEGNIPASTGIILYGPAGTYTMQTASSAPAVGTNLFVGTTAEASVPTDGSVYAMNKAQSDASQLVFAQYTGGTMPANKAYIQLAAGAPTLRFGFDKAADEFESDNFTTSLNAVAQQAQAVVYYDLLGRRVGDMTGRKGIFVVNGKKVLVK